jgi:hypothetical protein
MRNHWTGQGQNIKPNANPEALKGVIGKARPLDPRLVAANHAAGETLYRYRPTTAGRIWQEASSLGGLTKALPIGGKGMMAIGTGFMARDALKRNDPSGQERSRTERATGLAANTVGGLVGSSLGMRALGGRGGMWGMMAGGILGGTLAEKAVTAPFRALRRRAAPPQAAYGQPAQYSQPVQYAGGQGYAAPQGVPA